MGTEPHQPRDLRIGEWLFEAELHQLTGPEDSVHLEPRTTAVLLELVEHAGRVRTREELLDAVWGDAFVGEAVLTHCIWELRKAFADDAKNPSFIQTVPRRGYRLVAPVRQSPVVVVRALVAWTLIVAEGAVPVGSDPAPATDESESILTELLLTHRGERVQVGTEEARMGLFKEPTAALRFVLEAQSRLAALAGPVSLAIGVDMGEIEFCEASESREASAARTVKGPAVMLAQALRATALARQTLVSRSVFDITRTVSETVSPAQAKLRWLAHGDYVLAGDRESTELFEVGVEGFAPLVAPGATAQAKPLGIERAVLGWRPAAKLTIPQRPHWELTRKLGEGGFGEVWLTRHVKTGDHRVFKFCIEVDRLRALQREVTLFRLLKESLGSRRDITQILDWNFEEAPYFLELEYVEGGSFADWAESQGGLSEVPLATRLHIVAQAGEALSAAHSVGLLHKDVKPGNLLIRPGREGTPQACLADFGISRLADRGQLADAGITAAGLTGTRTSSQGASESGTRLYMAPELLEGKVATIQSDLYALGVVLFQAVVGRFDRAIGPGWQRDVDDPLLREEIARCVDLAPQRRPRSALEVAERLRTLEQRRARLEEEKRQREEAESLRRALVRAQRRRKLLAIVATAAVVVAAVVAVLTLLAVGARDRAQESRDRAERLVSFMLGDLRGTLEGVGRLDALAGTAQEVLDYYASVEVSDMGDDALARRAAALRQIGDVHKRTGALDQAAEAFAEAARVADSLVERDPARTSWQADRADSHFWLGDVMLSQGDLAGAAREFEKHRSIYAQLVAGDPSQTIWRKELAYGHGNLGTVLVELGEIEDALGHMQTSRAIIERLVADQPADPSLQLTLASSHHRVGEVLEQRGDLAGALERYQADYEILRVLAVAEPDDVRLQERLATSAGSVGLVHWLRGSPGTARPLYEIEAAVFAQLCTLDPENTDWQRNQAIAISNVGRSLEASGDAVAARRRYREASEIFKTLVAKDPTRTEWRTGLAQRHRLIASALLSGGNFAAALREVERAREILLGVLADRGDDRPAVRNLSMVDLLRAEILRGVDEPEQAQAAWEAALSAIEPLARESQQTRYLDPWARALMGLGQRNAAQPILDRLRERGYRAPDFVAFRRRFGFEG